jgi:hypothetical protein
MQVYIYIHTHTHTHTYIHTHTYLYVCSLLQCRLSYTKKRKGGAEESWQGERGEGGRVNWGGEGEGDGEGRAEKEQGRGQELVVKLKIR